jgi:hypothetical protein
MNLDAFKDERLGKFGVVFEVLGMAIILTLAQITLFHIFFADFMVNKYIAFYQDYIRKVDIFYRVFIIILTKIFGNSYTVSLYNFIEKIFIPVFLANLAYFTVRGYQRARK